MNNKAEKEIEDNTQILSEELKKMLVKDLNLSEGTQNALDHIKTVGELCRYSEKELLRFSCIGKARLEEIEKALKKYGLSLEMEIIENEEEKLEYERNIQLTKENNINFVISNGLIYNKFICNGIYTIDDLCKLDEKQIRNILESSILTKDIIGKIHSLGLKFQFEEKIIADIKMMKEIKNKNQEYSKDEIENMGIKDIFPCRIYTVLSRKGINNIGELCNFTENKLKDIRGLGDKLVDKIKEIIESLGLALKSEEVMHKEDKSVLKEKISYATPDDEKLCREINSLKLAYAQLEEKKNEYDLKIEGINGRIKELKNEIEVLNSIKKRVDMQQMKIREQLNGYEK